MGLSNAVYVCRECQRHATAPTTDPPSCGDLKTDMTRFPDGGWVRIETYAPHGEMVFHEIIVNPLSFAEGQG